MCNVLVESELGSEAMSERTSWSLHRALTSWMPVRRSWRLERRWWRASARTFGLGSRRKSMDISQVMSGAVHQVIIDVR